MTEPQVTTPTGEATSDGEQSEAADETSRRRLWLIGLGVVVAILLILWLFWSLRSDTSQTGAAIETSTATVTRQDLVERETVNGTLGFGDTTSLVASSQGTVTQLADSGTVLRRDDVLWRINQVPSRLWFGSVPAYRTLSQGTSGKDVRQAQQNLKALGYSGVTVDGEYSSGTADAVADWQEDSGLDSTGVLALGQVVFVDGAARAAAQLSPVGAPVQPGSALLTVTGNDRVVSLDLDTADRELVELDQAVRVELPDSTITTGTVTKIGAAQGGSSQSDPSGTVTTEQTIPVTVTLDTQKGARKWDTASVDVDLEADRAENVLTVPVTALLALAEGGYAVELVQDSGTTRLTGVETGLFADGRVEVRGTGIEEGVTVVVPG